MSVSNKTVIGFARMCFWPFAMSAEVQIAHCRWPPNFGGYVWDNDVETDHDLGGRPKRRCLSELKWSRQIGSIVTVSC